MFQFYKLSINNILTTHFTQQYAKIGAKSNF